MKNLYYSFLILIMLVLCPVYGMNSLHGLDGWQENTIDATKNARLHNNMGNIYFEEGNYVSALAEYKIAYGLTVNSSVSATYLYNIARCSMVSGYYQNAKTALLAAINKDCINMTYYKTLVDCIYVMGDSQKELNKYLKDNKNPYNKIVAGLIYLKTGKKSKAKSVFDDFIIEYPDMIITADVKNILKKI